MKNYNHLYLSGHRNITDEKYCKVKGLDPSLAGTPEINDEFIAAKDENAEIVRKRLAAAGLLGEEDDN